MGCRFGESGFGNSSKESIKYDKGNMISWSRIFWCWWEVVWVNLGFGSHWFWEEVFLYWTFYRRVGVVRRLHCVFRRRCSCWFWRHRSWLGVWGWRGDRCLIFLDLGWGSLRIRLLDFWIVGKLFSDRVLRWVWRIFCSWGQEIYFFIVFWLFYLCFLWVGPFFSKTGRSRVFVIVLITFLRFIIFRCWVSSC